MIVVVAALKGGVGKTTTAVYLAAVAGGGKRSVTLVDSDPQGSAADWVEHAADEVFESIDVVEAPTERLLVKTLDRVEADDVAVVDTPPGHERLLAKALERADVGRDPHPGRWGRDRPGRGGPRSGAQAPPGRPRVLLRPHLHP